MPAKNLAHMAKADTAGIVAARARLASSVADLHADARRRAAALPSA
jgi:hypothetical protein